MKTFLKRLSFLPRTRKRVCCEGLPCPFFCDWRESDVQDLFSMEETSIADACFVTHLCDYLRSIKNVEPREKQFEYFKRCCEILHLLEPVIDVKYEAFLKSCETSVDRFLQNCDTKEKKTRVFGKVVRGILQKSMIRSST